MSVKGNKKFILLGITVLTITILYGIYNFIKIQLVPITDFSLKQERSQQEGFAKSTIILNNQPYICDYDEFCLVTLNNTWDEVIGRDKNDNKVYSIKGQDEYSYVMFVEGVDIIKSLKRIKDSQISLKPQDMYWIELIECKLV